MRQDQLLATAQRFVEGLPELRELVALRLPWEPSLSPSPAGFKTFWNGEAMIVVDERTRRIVDFSWQDSRRTSALWRTDHELNRDALMARVQFINRLAGSTESLELLEALRADFPTRTPDFQVYCSPVRFGYSFARDHATDFELDHETGDLHGLHAPRQPLPSPILPVPVPVRAEEASFSMRLRIMELENIQTLACTSMAGPRWWKPRASARPEENAFSSVELNARQTNQAVLIFEGRFQSLDEWDTAHRVRPRSYWAYADARTGRTMTLIDVRPALGGSSTTAGAFGWDWGSGPATVFASGRARTVKNSSVTKLPALVALADAREVILHRPNLSVRAFFSPSSGMLEARNGKSRCQARPGKELLAALRKLVPGR